MRVVECEFWRGGVFAALLFARMVGVLAAAVPLVASGKEAPLPGTSHSFHMEGGDSRKGCVLGGEADGREGRWIRIHVQLSDGPTAEVLLKRKLVRRVDPLEWKFWESEIARKDPETLERGWQAMHVLLGLPGARVGAVGNALAGVRLRAGAIPSAKEFYTMVEESSADPEERDTARAGRLRSLMAQGKTREVAVEASAWTKDASQLDAWDILGESLLAETEKLIRKHPRWEQDRFVKPEVVRLLEEGLDSSLTAFVRHPIYKSHAARGLLRSARIYQIGGNSKLARQMASSVIAFYPQCQEQAEAAHLLSELGNPEPRNEDG